jgi:transposase
LTTKLHAIVRDDRLPLVMALTPGQSGDAPGGRPLLERLGPQSGQPQLVADRAYEGRPTQRCARALGWELVAPPHPNRHAARRRPLDRDAYRERNLVERFFNRLKRFRGIATRYHKLDVVYLHMIYLACIHIMTK